jgi:hypothetical protein
MGSRSFIESFVVEALHEDLGTIFNLHMLANLQATFVMFSLNYTQHLGYLLCIVFSSPSILQHYAKFDIRTIAMLEKLPGARSFGGFIGHLVCCQTNLFVFLGEFGFLL